MKKKKGNNLDKQFVIILILLLSFFVVVIPNSLRVISLPLFVLIGFLMPLFKVSIDLRLVVLWLIGSFMTLLYILIGFFNNAYPNAAPQVLFVYIVSPLIWIWISSFIFNECNPVYTVKYFLALSFVGAITVPFYLVTFLLWNPPILQLIIKTPNAVFSQNSAGVRMHVLGSLSFAIAGFFSTPEIISNRFLRFLVAFAFLVSILLCGRTAVFLSFVIGICFFIIYNKDRLFGILFGPHRRYVSFMLNCFGICSTIIICAFIIYKLLNFNIFAVIHNYMSFIYVMGGKERILQAKALIHGIAATAWLGAGHGVAVSGIIRNTRYPWRYELLYLVTIYRVGIIGFIIYALPVFLLLKEYIVLHNLFECKKVFPLLYLVDRFMFVGFVATIVISAADPYLESFEFQWMFWLPVVYFVNRKKICRRFYQ